ncbi:hypothetical protein [Bacillus sp. FJAT-52991]|uniref:Uncharacterized protein n=1 Tax=Bacillus kandeliae TaxID=3129297 RepID=A0ABZ2N667_9BACI
MAEKNFIQRNMASQDAFVKSLYTDLYTRIQEYEEKGSDVEKMKLSHAGSELFIVGTIAVFLMMVIL